MNAYLKKTVSQFLPILLVILISIVGLDYSVLHSVEERQAFTFNSNSSYWPTKEWKTSTPEEQGMDSALLADMFDEINEVAFDHLIHSILIIRNGYIVVEAYYPGHDRDTLFKIHSSTKSVTSALFGIALSKGYISSLDQSVVDYFPELKIKDIGLKKQITLKHLLTMSSGLEWPELATIYTNPENPVMIMLGNEDSAKYVLDRPISKQPGSEFNYNSGCSQLLAAIIHKKTGNSLEFAKKYLFSPLGISNYDWSTDSDGVINGFGGLQMRTRDMAKFGYLYLKGGHWEGQQVIPSAWVKESTSGHIKKYGHLPRRNIPYYGYQWYIHSLYFHSFGNQGQYIFVIPKHEMVVVFTSGLTPRQYSFIPHLIEHYIISSAKETKPIPKNSKAAELLNSKIKKFNAGWRKE
jgi:CubicO group peptidase (beta-lactamase class C family)